MSNPRLLTPAGEYVGRATALAGHCTETLTAQRDLYIQLAHLARQQSDHVAAGESEELMSVLAARSRLIDQLAPLDRQLQPHKDKWHEVLDSLAADDRATVSGLLTQVQQLLADILEQDEADRQALIRQKSEVGNEISRAVTGTQLNRAYGAQAKICRSQHQRLSTLSTCTDSPRPNAFDSPNTFSFAR